MSGSRPFRALFYSALLTLCAFSPGSYAADEAETDTSNALTINEAARIPTPEVKKIPPSEGDTPAEGEKTFISLDIHFINLTDNIIMKSSDSLAHGCWAQQPDTLAPHSVALIKAESCGLATGTEGSVVYKLAYGEEFTVYFDVPYIGSNSYSVNSSSSDYKITYSGGSGNNATIKVYLTPVTTPTRFNAVIASDSQAWRLDDSSDPNSTSNQPPWESLNANVVKAINDQTSSADFLLINGDVTEFGRPGQRDSFYSIYNKLRTPFLYGLGNHDYANNVNDCTNGLDLNSNACAITAIDAMDNEAEEYKKLMPYHFSYDFNSNSERGSLAYSWDYGNFHFVQLQNYPTYAVNLDSDRVILSSMDWLEKDLKSAVGRGKIPVLNFHDYNDHFARESSEADKTRFKNMMLNYNVLAIFAGHTHNQGITNEAGGNALYGDTVVYDSGALFKGDFLDAKFEEDCVTVSVYNGKNGSASLVRQYDKRCKGQQINTGTTGITGETPVVLESYYKQTMNSDTRCLLLGSSGQAVSLNTCKSQTDGQIILNLVPSGDYFMIKPDKNTNLCMRTFAGNTDVGMDTCDAAGTSTDFTSMRLWQLDISGGRTTLVNKYRGDIGSTDRCLRTFINSDIAVGDCSGAGGASDYTSMREWKIYDLANTTRLQNYNKHAYGHTSQQCLSVAAGENAWMGDCDAPEAQLYLTDAGNDYYLIHSALYDTCLRTQPAESNTSIQLDSCAGSGQDWNSYRMWKMLPSGSYFLLENKARGDMDYDSLCAKTEQGGGTDVGMGNCSGTTGDDNDLTSLRQWSRIN